MVSDEVSELESGDVWRSELTPESKVIDLLAWAKDHGLQPSNPRKDDLFLEPFSKRIVKFRDLKPHQHRTAYWIPNRRGLAQLGLSTTMTKVKDMVVMQGRNLIGAGVGESEAALSLVNQMRKTLHAA